MFSECLNKIKILKRSTEIFIDISWQNKKRKKFDNAMEDIPATEDFLVR